MPPPNLDAATAIEITSLPFEVTTDPEDNANELWYHYVTTSGDVPLLGAHVYNGGSYKPQIAVSVGPVDTYVDHPAGFGFYATMRAILVPVDDATEYWFRVTGGTGSSYSGGQTFTLTVYNAPSSGVSRGAIVVPDDTQGFPASVLDPSTGDVLRYVDFPSGEFADTLPTGHLLTEDLDHPNDLQLYDGRLNLVTTLSGLASGTMRIRSNANDLFYTSNGTTLTSVTTDGSIGDTWTLAATPVSLAPARDNSVLYYASSGTNEAVRTWDLVADTAGSNLAAGIASYFVGEMFPLDDGTLLVHYFKTSGGVDHMIKRYDSGGSVVQTYNFGTTEINHLAWADDDEHIRVWTQSGGQGTFREMALSDGTLSTGFSQYDYVAGVSEESPTATPQTFGHSFSCPFITFFGTLTAPILDPSEPCCLDFSSLLKAIGGCDTGPALGPGSTGPLGQPATGTWTNSLNATSGGTGGGTGASWVYPDPSIFDSWV